MSELATLSYGLASAGWLVLLLLLLTSWRGRLQGGLLVFTVLLSLPWGLRAAYLASAELAASDWWYQALEVIRNVAWLGFLAHLLEPLAKTTWPRRWWLWNWVIPLGTGLLLLGVEFREPLGIVVDLPPDIAILGHIILAIIGLAIIEHLFRNTQLKQRWATKFLYLGTGLMFAYDFFMYADALLFKKIDLAIWEARGFVNAMAVPLIAVAATRNPEWSVRIFVSRQMTQYSTAVFGAGLYLLAMASAGYYIREFSKTWGTTLYAAFIAGAGLLLAMLLFSGQIRARVRVLLNKHFYALKYDYREEWLRFTRTLSLGEASEPPRSRAIRAIAEIVHSSGGLLWTRRGQSHFSLQASWNMHEPPIREESANGSLVQFLEQRKWVIELDQYAREPEMYADLTLPDWLCQLQQAWLVIPLLQSEQLTGFLVLAQCNTQHHSLNWEDHDLLKTAGRQIAGYIALLDSSEALWEARQFEAFHRLSAYVVHDIKNIAAQLALVVANSTRHKNNPIFIEDAFQTVSNATDRMNRLLAQLRTERPSARIRSIALASAVQKAVTARSGYQPKPLFQEILDDDPWVRVDQERLISVLEHLIQNAQEATDSTGQIELKVYTENKMAVVSVCDNGCGMDEQFIRERLFRPFTTTKGNAGMGIGVYETYDFARGAGGELTVESSPGNGTTFYLRLPRIENPVIANLT